MAIGQITSITENVKGLAYTGIMTGAASTTSIVAADLVGFGNNNDVFNTDFVVVVLLNANAAGTAPEGEVRDITDYVTATGTFTVTAFSQNVEPGDIVLIARRELFIIDGVALKTTPITNSLAYRLSQFLASGDGDWATGQPLPSNTSLVDLFGAFTGPVGGVAQDDNVKASLDLVHTEIAALPTDADVNTEVDTALNTIVPASPTAGSVNDILSKAAGGNTFVKATDSLEALGEDSDTILADTNELQTDWVNGGRLDLLIDAILARTSYGSVVRKTVAFDGGAGNGAIGTVALFTVTGDVRVKLTAICSETLVGAATLECGIAGATATIIAQIPDATALTLREIWCDATPTTVVEPDSNIPRVVISSGEDIILTIGAAAITDGTIKFVVEYEALSTDGAVAAA